MKYVLPWCLLLLWGCQKESKDDFLGSAVLNCPSYKLATEVPGQILWDRLDEGKSVRVGDTLALLDTTMIELQIKELVAQIQDFNINLNIKKLEVNPLETSLSALLRESQRMQNLLKEGAIPTQKYDEIQDQITLLKVKKNLILSTVEAQKSKNLVLQQSLNRLLEQKKRSWIISPFSGQIQSQWLHQGEMAKPAQVLAEIQNTDTLEGSFYVPQAFLNMLKIGQFVRLRVEQNEGEFTMVNAFITQIAQDAQFTPKGAQTRENRAELVFEIKFKVANPQKQLHPGLPVEVWR